MVDLAASPAPPAPGDRGQQDYWDYTFSPWHGCTHVGRPGFSGCDNCYAEVGDARLLHDTVTHWGPDAPRLMMSDQRWRQPLAWNRQAAKEGTHKLIFCGSMCDVMERRPDLDAPRHRLFRLVESTPNLIWMLFTKRPQEYAKMLPKSWLDNPRQNVWLVATVEAMEYMWRIDPLLDTPAVVHGVIVEPILGPVVLPDKFLARGRNAWVITGGESGRHARPAQIDVDGGGKVGHYGGEVAP